VRVLPQERARANDDVHAVHTRLDGQTGVVHVTPDVCEDLGLLEAELADCLAVRARLGGRGGRGELDVFDSKVVEPKGRARLARSANKGTTRCERAMGDAAQRD
jgi:hypothetical protein